MLNKLSLLSSRK